MREIVNRHVGCEKELGHRQVALAGSIRKGLRCKGNRQACKLLASFLRTLPVKGSGELARGIREAGERSDDCPDDDQDRHGAVSFQTREVLLG